MRRKIILGVLFLIFIGYAGWNFAYSVTPYVSVNEAKSGKGSVQVKGLLCKLPPAPHMEDGEFVFVLEDEDTGETLPVRYKGTKPDQFDEAYHIVAVGSYRDGAFYADRLLIKCPSKYENQRK